MVVAKLRDVVLVVVGVLELIPAEDPETSPPPLNEDNIMMGEDAVPLVVVIFFIDHPVDDAISVAATIDDRPAFTVRAAAAVVAAVVETTVRMDMDMVTVVVLTTRIVANFTIWVILFISFLFRQSILSFYPCFAVYLMILLVVGG